jgi:chorismate mutase/prephenate dehydratase
MDDSPDSGESPESPGSLESLRKKVNHADTLLLDALIKRFRVAEEIGTYKSRKRASSFDQIREAEIVRRAHRVAQKAGIPRDGFERIIRAVIDYCRKAVEGKSREPALEKAKGSDSVGLGKPRVTFPGESGAFSEEAAYLLRPGCVTVPARSFMEVVKKVERGEVEFGVLPVENTIAGGVTSAYETLVEGSVRVLGEVAIPIELQLVGTEDANLELAREVWSHPIALGQCKRFFQQWNHLSAVELHDTAGAAREVATLGDDSILAICSKSAAQLYGLKIVGANIQDRLDNQTRFFMIEKKEDRAEFFNQSNQVEKGLSDSQNFFKTVLTVETSNKPGALRDLLSALAEEGYDLAYLESRPTGVPWTYRFFLEVKHRRKEDTDRIQELLMVSATRIAVVGIFRTT